MHPLFYFFTFLSRVLPCAHTSLNHIHHIVAELLALRHDIHVHCADSISVLVVVDVVDVLRNIHRLSAWNKQDSGTGAAVVLA